MADGFIPLLKVPGPTSHDVTQFIRRRLRERAGHLGTLDPAASGVLVVALGRARRLTQYLMSLPKAYRAVIRLGIRTATGDLEGDVIEEASARQIDRESVRKALGTFPGRRFHRPPRASAIKVAGEPAYRAFRRGEDVEVLPREIQIQRADLTNFTPGEAAFAEVTFEVSAGTYIRTLAEEVGEALGVPATLEALLRTDVGPFSLDAAVTAEEAVDGAGWHPVGYPFHSGPRLLLTPAEAESCRHGRPIPLEDPDALPEGPIPAFWGDELLAMGRREESVWRPTTVLWP